MRILMPIDTSVNSSNALDFLTERKSMMGAKPEVTLLNVQMPLPARAIRLVGEESLKEYYEEEAQKVFEGASAIFEKAGISAQTLFRVGVPVDMISEECERLSPDLIVMGSRGQSPLKGLFFGSVSNGVLANTQCPILMLRGKPQTSGDALKIGIAVDNSKYAFAAVEYLLKNIDFFGRNAEFYLINTVNDYAGSVMPDMAGMALPALSEDEVVELQKDEFNETIEPLRSIFEQAEIKAKEVCLVGNPGTEISNFAEKQGLDLIVMGSHGYGRFKSAVMGSTAMRIASSGNVPLLIIRKE